MSQVKQTEASRKLGSEEGNCTDYEGLGDCAKKMEELQDMVNQKINSIIGMFEDMNQKIMKIQLTLDELLATTRITPENKIQDTKQRCLKLQFNGTISLPILTGEKIKAEGGNYMQVFLVDNCTGTAVEFGPEASAKVEIVALEGDLNDWEGDTSTDKEFRSNIAGEREGKKSILAGNVQLKLNKGLVSLSDVKFRCSASHSSGVFKLGARAVDTFHGTRIIEAITKSFQVKDYRKKYTQKHYPPSASDEVWRLENIGKCGAILERLTKEEVNSVEDFNTLLSKDPERLKRLIKKAALSHETLLLLILNGYLQLLGLSEKKWEATVTHAQTCPADNTQYCCQENTEVVNAIGQVPGHISDCEHGHGSMLIASAHEHEGVVSFGNEASLLQYTSHSSTAAEPVSSSRLESRSGNYIECSETDKFDQTKLNTPFEDTLSSSDPEMGQFDHTNLNTPSEDTLSSFKYPTGFSSIRDSGFQSIDNMEIMNICNSSLQGLGCSASNSPFIIHYCHEYDVSDLLNEVPTEEFCDNHKSADTAVMFIESQAVDPKKIWTTMFHISKWLSRRKRIASIERNQDQKRQRV